MYCVLGSRLDSFLLTHHHDISMWFAQLQLQPALHAWYNPTQLWLLQFMQTLSIILQALLYLGLTVIGCSMCQGFCTTVLHYCKVVNDPAHSNFLVDLLCRQWKKSIEESRTFHFPRDCKTLKDTYDQIQHQLRALGGMDKDKLCDKLCGAVHVILCTLYYRAVLVSNKIRISKQNVLHIDMQVC